MLLSCDVVPRMASSGSVVFLGLETSERCWRGREGFAPLGRVVIGVKVFCWDQIESTNNKTPRAIGVLERKMSFLTERQPKYKK